jgi:aminoglycoside 2'-N-acetyltransferase I
VGEAIVVRLARTEDLDSDTRASVIAVCVEAHANDDFNNLFSYIPSGGRHALGYHGSTLVSHAVSTTRWLQPAGQPPLRTAYVDAVSTLPSYEGLGYGSAVMRRLADDVDGHFAIGCLETDRHGFYSRLGWQLWRGPLAGRATNGDLVPTPDQTGVMVLRLSDTPELDLDASLTIECQPHRIW